jgi:salicylate hydroxylase
MLRIPRDAILGVLVDTARERGVDIRFDHRFAHAITTEDTLMSAPVTLVFNNAAPRSASLVVGADGLRSCVRNLTPTFNASPRYTGQSLIAWTVPRRQLRYPVPLSEVPWSMALATRRGMVLFVPEDPDGKRVRVAVQLGLVDREFAAWKALGEKRDVLLEIVRRGGEGVAGAEGDWPDLVASAIEIANADHQMPVFLWPYYTMPMLETWVAGTERLVLLGDAAHVFPPTGGQGAGMAIEDAYGLGMALGEATIWTDVSRVLPQWQRWRQERVQQVAEFSSQVGKSRMALARTDGPVEEDMGWLYGWRLPEDWWHWRQREMPNSSIALGNTPSSSEHLVT